LNVSLKNIVPILNAKWVGLQTNSIIENISIDSRSLQNSSQTLFFAIVGPNNDAHTYIESLLLKGVQNFVVTHIPENLENKANFLIVENTLDALQIFATYHRSQFDFPIIGITGSNGKTIVKEWLNFLLSPDYNTKSKKLQFSNWSAIVNYCYQ
jgi:Alr-MurF fusion protein